MGESEREERYVRTSENKFEGADLCCGVGIYFLRAGRNVCAIFEKAGGLCCLVPTTAEPNINLQKSLV